MFKVACSLFTILYNFFAIKCIVILSRWEWHSRRKRKRSIQRYGAFPLFSKSQAGRVGFTYCSETPSLTSIPTVTLNRDSNPRLRKVRKQWLDAACTKSREYIRREGNVEGKGGEQDSEREKKKKEGPEKYLRKENPILRVSVRNEAGSRDFGTDSTANYPLYPLWRSGLVL